MTHTKKILISFLVLAVCGNVMQAQEAAPRHEVSVAFQGLGLGSMPFSGSASWEDQPGLSLGFNVGYTYWFGEHFGFRTGVRLSRFSHNQKISNFDLPISANLPMSSLGLPGGSALTTVSLRGTATSIQEEQSYTYLELPIQLAMRFGGVFVNVGLSLSKAVNATADYSVTDPSLAITAIPDLGITPATPVPMTLNGVTEKNVKNADMTKPFYCLLDAEVGYNFPIGDATSLSLGLYGRYAPVADKTDNNVDIYALSPDATFTVTQPSTAAQVEKMGYYEVGLSLGVNFGITNRQKRMDEMPRPIMTSANNQADATAAELTAAKAAREKAESELASAKSAREKAEAELAAMKAARQKAESDMDAYRKSMAEQQAQMKPEKQYIDHIVFNFDVNETQPIANAESEARLQKLCDAMKNDASIQVTVTGYTDNTGTIKENLKIGRQRASAVKRMMTKMGAPARNITVATNGENNPVDSNNTKEGRAQNRRATVEVK